MMRFLTALMVSYCALGLSRPAGADDHNTDKNAAAILDKAMNALGGEDTLSRIDILSWKAKGKLKLGDQNEPAFTSEITVQGLDRVRSERELDLPLAPVKTLAILDGDKPWIRFGGLPLRPDKAVTMLRHGVYLNVIPVTLVPLKGQGFHVEAAGEDQVEGEPAAVLKVTCPDGYEFTLFFDKQSGLPVRTVGKVIAIDGQESTDEATYSEFKDFGGIKKATRIAHKRDGIVVQTEEITEFKILEKVDAQVFAVPKEADPTANAPTVAGPESDKLLPATRGYVLFAFGSDQPDGMPDADIVAVELPSRKPTVVRPTMQENDVDMPTIHAISGPDSQGRVAYVEDHFFVKDEKTRRHLLKIIQLDGTKDTELFTRRGDAMWALTSNGEIGSGIALAPVGGRVALQSGLVSVKMPTCLLHVGSVEIWDVEKKSGHKTDIQAVDGGLAWSPDGKRLAYVKLVPSKQAPVVEAQTDSFGQTFQNWDRVPVVFIRDIDAGTESALHVGLKAIVSFDGNSVAVSDEANVWRCVDMASGKSIAARCPGLWGPVALPTKDMMLALCYPTEGIAMRFTKSNSPLVGPKQMLSLKLVRMNTNDFQTVIPNIDPRACMSFGVIKAR